MGKTFDTISQDFYPSNINIAETGSDTMYASSATNLYRTTDGGQTEWKRVLYKNFNRNEINDVAIHPRNAKLVALAVGGSTKVLLTRDAGENWERWKDDLPTFQALTITWQDDDLETIYLGMDVGVYYRDINCSSWQPFSYGIPNVKVNEIEINNVTNQIFAGTYGRGLWGLTTL